MTRRRTCYTVEEIDTMRHAVRQIADDRDPVTVEAYLRTYMLNGTTPQELVDAGRAALERLIEHQQHAWERLEKYDRPKRAEGANWL